MTRDVERVERIRQGLREAALEALASHPQASIETVMQSGLTTIRPNWTLERVVAYLQKQDMESVLITTSDGELMGLLDRSEAERRLRASPASGKSEP
jgi:predicted transcriptional regulator